MSETFPGQPSPAAYSFAGLSPVELELLALLAEECGELVHSSEAECDHGQRAGEALRGAP